MKNLRIEIKWGIIFTIALMLWTLLERLFGLHSTHIDKQPVYTLFFIIPAFVIYYLALVEKRETYYAGQMNWTQGFVSGLVISIVVSLLSPVSQFITHEFISPNYFENAIEYGVSSGQFETHAQAEETFNLVSYIFESMIFAVISGAVTSAIVAIFTKKKYA
ncbi:MAG: DUF4199 domain-containing protein [Cyclobacteriaceae bacterium]